MITAKIIADSISHNGKRITTFELEYARFIHSEFMTHRMVSKNAASSRAIPINVTIQHIQENPALPVYWGRNQSGMSAKEELNKTEIEACLKVWFEARDNAIESAKKLSDLGLHKQIVNRILEPWANIKVVATATEWDNLFYLRRHPDAQPEFHALANAMWDVYSASKPKLLGMNKYHLPYISDEELDKHGIETCLKLSASLCAQVSYRKSDESVDKALMIYDRLTSNGVLHASPFEHQAKPASFASDRSGNFFGWQQYRQTFTNHTCWKYKS